MRQFINVTCLSLLLAGCAMTPQQKKWTGIVAGVLVVGAIAANKADRGDDSPTAGAAVFGKPGIPCHPQPDGSCR
jgi:hypothetical protein